MVFLFSFLLVCPLEILKTQCKTAKLRRTRKIIKIYQGLSDHQLSITSGFVLINNLHDQKTFFYQLFCSSKIFVASKIEQEEQINFLSERRAR